MQLTHIDLPKLFLVKMEHLPGEASRVFSRSFHTRAPLPQLLKEDQSWYPLRATPITLMPRLINQFYSIMEIVCPVSSCLGWLDQFRNLVSYRLNPAALIHGDLSLFVDRFNDHGVPFVFLHLCNPLLVSGAKLSLETIQPLPQPCDSGGWSDSTMQDKHCWPRVARCPKAHSGLVGQSPEASHRTQ